MKICYLPANIDAAGCLRCLFPARELRRLGHDAAMCPHVVHPQADGTCVVQFTALTRDDEGRTLAMPIDRLLPLIDADIYVFQMPLDAGVHEVIRQLQGMGKTVVCEADDDHLGVPSYNPAFEGTCPRLHPDRNRDWLFKSYAAADAMSVSTPFLKERYAHLNSDIVVVPNYLDWEMWEDVVPAYERPARRVRVGWMGQMKWRAGDLAVLRGVIGPWLERNPQVEFVAAGDPSVHDFLGVPKAQRVTTGSVHFSMLPSSREQAQMLASARLPIYLHRLADITACIDIGLVPLERNDFNEAKSALKGMEYAACGAPCIASPTGSYQDWVGDQVGFLAKRAPDWVRALDALAGDADLRARMGAAARAKARAHTIAAHVGKWEGFFAGCLRDNANCSVEAGVAA